MGIGKAILLGTAVAGTLDLASAFFFAGMAGMGAGEVLEFVASGPFGDAALHNPAFALPGTLVHYLIMACMVAAYALLAPRLAPGLFARPIAAGILYGLLLWGIMYWIVRPMRWPAMPLPHTLKGISQQLFSHIVCVGIPIALVTRRMLAPRG